VLGATVLEVLRSLAICSLLVPAASQALSERCGRNVTQAALCGHIASGCSIKGVRFLAIGRLTKRLLHRHAYPLTTWGAVFVCCRHGVSMIFGFYRQVALYFFAVSL
jgi:hypothetical protein